MKNIFLISIIFLVVAACNKASTPTPSGTTPPPVDTTVTSKPTGTTPPPTKTDSVTLVESKWLGYRDSIANNNYDDPQGGYPIPGVIYNRAGDYWDFLSNGTVNVVINGSFYTSTYTYSSTNKITIAALASDNAKPCTITKLTDSVFIFFCTDTSSKGGTYYREVWLKK